MGPAARCLTNAPQLNHLALLSTRTVELPHDIYSRRLATLGAHGIEARAITAF